MKRTTVKVPDDLDARLRHETELRGTTVSEITREALDSYRARSSQVELRGDRSQWAPRRLSADRAEPAAGVGQSPSSLTRVRSTPPRTRTMRTTRAVATLFRRRAALSSY